MSTSSFDLASRNVFLIVILLDVKLAVFLCKFQLMLCTQFLLQKKVEHFSTKSKYCTALHHLTRFLMQAKKKKKRCGAQQTKDSLIKCETTRKKKIQKNKPWSWRQNYRNEKIFILYKGEKKNKKKKRHKEENKKEKIKIFSTLKQKKTIVALLKNMLGCIYSVHALIRLYA